MAIEAMSNMRVFFFIIRTAIEIYPTKITLLIQKNKQKEEKRLLYIEFLSYICENNYHP